MRTDDEIDADADELSTERDIERSITPYLYYGNPVSVTDGDTMRVSVDLGFNITQEVTVRLLGIDTAEMPSHIHFPNVKWRHIDVSKNPQYKLAKEQTEFVEAWFETASDRAGDDWALLVDTKKDGTGKYGRLLADFYRRDVDGNWDTKTSLADALVHAYGESVRAFY